VRNGLAWFKAAMWKLGQIKKGTDRGRCPLCIGKREVLRIALKRFETRNWREPFLAQETAGYRRGSSEENDKLYQCCKITEYRGI
jgi:hypothetical protein